MLYVLPRRKKRVVGKVDGGGVRGVFDIIKKKRKDKFVLNV